MTQLYLHIGTEKTGTTSIQGFLKANRALLREKGILYPTAPGNRNHTGLAVAAIHEKTMRSLRKVTGVRTPEDVEAFRSKLIENLGAELASSDCHTAIMSGEHCSSNLVQDSEVAWLHDMLSRFFEKITVVVYIRRQDDYLLSTYSTTIKSGRTRPLMIPTGPRVERRYNHAALLSRWAKVFGREAIICRKFEKTSLLDGNVIRDFLDAVGISQDLPFEWPEVANESLDANTLEFLRLFNNHIPRFVEREVNATRGNLVKLLNEISAGPLATLSNEELADFMSQFRESNREVAREYFGGELAGSDDPLFAPRADTRERTLQPVLTVERAVEIAAWLWQQKQAEVERLEASLAGREERPGKRRRRQFVTEMSS